jgi:hypothetical protein
MLFSVWRFSAPRWDGHLGHVRAGHRRRNVGGHGLHAHDPQPDASSAFVLELPPYRSLRLKSVLIHMWENTREFVRKAGTVILARHW